MPTEATKSYNFIVSKQQDVVVATAVTGQFAKELGFNAVKQAKIATAVSELANNIVKYAGTGQISVGVIRHLGQLSIEIIVRDEGPGILDFSLAMTDNYSTGGGLGIGLPGVKRLMDEFYIDSSEGVGTKIVVRKWLPNVASKVKND